MQKRHGYTIMACGLLTLALTGTALAGATDDPVIQKREQRQEQRIQQGVNGGELTPGEAGRLERQQARIKQGEERMKADGKLTRRERAKLTREQNRAGRNIYRKKHNARKVDDQ